MPWYCQVCQHTNVHTKWNTRVRPLGPRVDQSLLCAPHTPLGFWRCREHVSQVVVLADFELAGRASRGRGRGRRRRPGGPALQGQRLPRTNSRDDARDRGRPFHEAAGGRETGGAGLPQRRAAAQGCVTHSVACRRHNVLPPAICMRSPWH